eukprot:589981-Amphidinium_carterae.1
MRVNNLQNCKAINIITMINYAVIACWLKMTKVRRRSMTCNMENNTIMFKCSAKGSESNTTSDYDPSQKPALFY